VAGEDTSHGEDDKEEPRSQVPKNQSNFIVQISKAPRLYREPLKFNFLYLFFDPWFSFVFLLWFLGSWFLGS